MKLVSAGFFGIVIIVAVILSLLPAERVGEVRTTLPAAREDIYRLVTDLRSQNWRSSLNELKLLDATDGAEVWLEVPKKGPEMKFKTLSKVVPERFEIVMIDNPSIEAQWVGRFQATTPTTTEIHFVEKVHLKGWFAKGLSYLFFDVQASVEQYVEDLKVELMRSQEAHHG